MNGDYTPLSGSITFGPGVTSRTFSIALTDPGYNLNGDQTVNLTLSNPTGGAQARLVSDGHADAARSLYASPRAISTPRSAPTARRC